MQIDIRAAGKEDLSLSILADVPRTCRFHNNPVVSLADATGRFRGPVLHHPIYVIRCGLPLRHGHLLGRPAVHT